MLWHQEKKPQVESNPDWLAEYRKDGMDVQQQTGEKFWKQVIIELNWSLVSNPNFQTPLFIYLFIYCELMMYTFDKLTFGFLT